MIKLEYHDDTDEVEVTVEGTKDAITLEIGAFRELLMRDDRLLNIWILGLKEEINKKVDEILSKTELTEEGELECPRS